MGSRFSRATEKKTIVSNPIHTQILPLSTPSHKFPSPEFEINTYQAQLSRQPSDCLIRCSSVTGELLKQIQQIRNCVGLEELECELFSLCRDHQEALLSSVISLESVELVHHLSKLQEIAGDLSQDETDELWSDIQKVVEMRPLAVVEYKWTDRMLTFLSRLMVKWELVDVNLYKYRNNVSSPVGRVQEQEHARRLVSILCMDTLWFACACTHPPMSLLISPSLHKLASALHTRVTDAIKFALDLNRRVDFAAHPGIEDAIGLSCERVFPQILARSPTRDSPEKDAFSDKRNSMLNSARKQRLKSAKKIGFHLLDLPSVPCKCFEKDHHRRNLIFKSLLVNIEQLYRVFELEFLEAAENLKDRERGEAAGDTLQSRSMSAANSLVESLPQHWVS